MKTISRSAKTLGALMGLLFIISAGVASAQVIYGGGFGSYQQVPGYAGYPYAQGYTCPQLVNTLMLGMRGSEVSALQQFLATRYSGQLVTGYFGPLTLSNVMRFQSEQGLASLGSVGPQTRAAIARLCGGVSYPPSFPPYSYPHGRDGEITLQSPDRGDDFEVGERVQIEWKLEDEPQNSIVQLDLYNSHHTRIGTIEAVSRRDDNYRWEIPEGGEYCTLQYPNGLCGVYLSGDYYIRALLMYSGYVIDSDESGLFSIHQGSRDGDVAQFSAWPTSGNDPLRVTFTIAAEGGEYTLDFDDGDDTEVRIPAIYCFAAPCVPPPVYVTHTFDDEGTYSVELKDEDDDVVGRLRITVR